jgi:type II secretory pathway pseudopilin PulG
MPKLPTVRPAERTTRRPAFSIVELLTVVFIIGVLIAILIPTVSSVQRSGRSAAAQSLLTEVSTAAASFQLDTRRLPGYFAQSELGSTTNFNTPSSGPGLTAMENALLDLSGQGAIATSQPTDASAWVQVNPTADDDKRIWVKPDLIGSQEGNYFIPGSSALAFMTAQQQPGTITSGQPAGPGLPDLVDPFGQPILAWAQDERAPSTVRSAEQFAARASDGNTRARFYWTANGSILSSTSLGELGRDMTTTPAPGSGGSLIGRGASGNEVALRGVMNALLGHPGYPDEAALAANNYSEVFPRQARGSFVVHSAGPDGVFLSASDKRAGRLLATDMLGGGNLNITYGVNFFTSAAGGQNNRRRGENNQPETVDFLDAFDDLVVAQ